MDSVDLSGQTLDPVTGPVFPPCCRIWRINSSPATSLVVVAGHGRLSSRRTIFIFTLPVDCHIDGRKLRGPNINIHPRRDAARERTGSMVPTVHNLVAG